jgi:hypothetical protein
MIQIYLIRLLLIIISTIAIFQLFFPPTIKLFIIRDVEGKHLIPSEFVIDCVNGSYQWCSAYVRYPKDYIISDEIKVNLFNINYDELNVIKLNKLTFAFNELNIDALVDSKFNGSNYFGFIIMQSSFYLYFRSFILVLFCLIINFILTKFSSYSKPVIK